MELKAGMPIWAKENNYDFTKGKDYIVEKFKGDDLLFYVLDDVGDIFAIDGDYAEEHFTTTTPKEEIEIKQAVCCEDSTGQTAVMCCNLCGKPTEPFWKGEQPEAVFKSLEEGQKFLFEKDVYIKTREVEIKNHSDSVSASNAVKLSGEDVGEHMFFASYNKVKAIINE